MFAKYIKLTMRTSSTVEFWDVTQLYTIGTQLVIITEDDKRSYTTQRFHITELMRMEVEFS